MSVICLIQPRSINETRKITTLWGEAFAEFLYAIDGFSGLYKAYSEVKKNTSSQIAWYHRDDHKCDKTI